MADKIQLITCTVALAGDIRNTVVRDAFSPVTYPEYLLLQMMHGEGAVSDAHDIGTVDRTPDEERKRLSYIYGEKLVATAFPGVGFQFPFANGRIPKAPLPVPTQAPAQLSEPAPVAPVDMQPVGNPAAVDTADPIGVPPVGGKSKPKGA